MSHIGSNLEEYVDELSKDELHHLLDDNHLFKIQEVFAENNKRLNDVQLRNELTNVADIIYTDEEWDLLFMRMNYKRDGYVTWDDFLSFLILGFNQDEIKPGFAELDQPIPNNYKVLRSKHCYPINRITYFPTVYPDRSISFMDSSILTCSNDGTINYWSLDLEFERSVKSSSQTLKVQTTWVTDMVTLPDLSVICLTSTERDLRFYDTSARKFELRIFFTYLPNFITAMYYYFSQDAKEESKLLLGDTYGGIQILFITAFDRGPFKSKLGMPLFHSRYENVIHGLVAGFRVVNFPKQHTDFVRQLAYNPQLRNVISCADCPHVALAITDIQKDAKSHVFVIPRGAWCFAFYEGIHLIATGSSDCLVRLWNPFMPSHPIATFHGHHRGIIGLVLQDNATRMYSLSQDKCIKVWDIASQSCIQTFMNLPPELGEHSDLTTFYNPKSREWIFGSAMLAAVKLSPKKPGEHTDGTTHAGGVSIIIYNALHKVIITCGLDSRIITWNPWDGRKLCCIENAHTTTQYAKIIPIEITAATLDPGQQRLLTGAHDGSLKIWNFNTGICLRNMRLMETVEIKSVVWVLNRILAMGWNRRVTEFSDAGDILGQEREFYKNWTLGHSEDISCAVVRVPQTLVTSTYDGELTMWKLETGQAYKRFNASDPTSRIKIQYKADMMKEKKAPMQSTKSIISNIRKSIVPNAATTTPRMEQQMSQLAPSAKKYSRRVSMVELPEQCIPLRKPAVHMMHFLQTRIMAPDVGTLLVALENGSIQIWSHHIKGGFITSFYAIHKAGDYIISMTSDQNDEFLFTGTSIGYIKTWLLVNYCTGTPDTDGPLTLVQMMKYRLTFPFLWGQFFLGRAERMVANQPKPMLLNSYKAHISSISSVTFVDMAKMLVSGSADGSARMWTLAGRYIQTIGTFKPWKFVYPFGVSDTFNYTIPPDLKRILSSTSFRVLNGGHTVRQLSLKQLQKQTAKEMTRIDPTKIYGTRLKEPVLNKSYTDFYRRKEGSKRPPPIKLETNFPYIPLYKYLSMPPPNFDEIQLNIPTLDENEKG